MKQGNTESGIKIEAIVPEQTTSKIYVTCQL